MKKFNRKSDMENLKQIPIIETLLMGLKEDIGEVKIQIRSYNGLKTDVNWLKKIWWWIAGAMSLTIVAVIGIITKIVIE